MKLYLFLFLTALAYSIDKPNFVIIYTDDQGYGDLSCFGGTHVDTPRIDQMAAEGARLTNFYMAAAVCTPSRAALMTGTYPHRIGMTPILLSGSERGLNPSEITIPELLQEQGYKTGMFGKWHLGDQPEFLPTRQGFQEFFGLPYSHDVHPYNKVYDPKSKNFNFPPLPLLEHETVIESEPDADYLTQRFTERAVKFIKENKDNPFFLYVPHPMPHVPVHASPEFMKGVSPETLKKLEAEDGNIDYETRRDLFRQCVREIDWSVGRILDTLKESGIDENTVVIFSTDNGPVVGNAGPLRGAKGSYYEGGLRVPTVIRWPGTIPAGKDNHELMTAMDLLPTFAKLAGASVPTDRTIDGQDIMPVLLHQEQSPHEAFFYFFGSRLMAVRSGQWKLHITEQKITKKTVNGKEKVVRAFTPGVYALYNLESDIGETTNLAADHPEIVARLQGYADAFQEDLKKNSRPVGKAKDPKPLILE